MAHTTVARLAGEVSEARGAALEAWSEAMTPLDRKFVIYNSALREWHTGQRARSEEANPGLLALVAPSAILAASCKFGFLSGNARCDKVRNTTLL